MPVEPCHLLIVPKRHVERYEELTEMELTQIGRVIKWVDKAAKRVFGTSAYLIHQKNGKEVGQSVPHVHFHYVGREEGDTSQVKFVMKLLYAQMLGPISQEEMTRNTEALAGAMASD